MSRRLRAAIAVGLLVFAAATEALAQGGAPQGLVRLNRVVSRYLADGSTVPGLLQNLTHDPAWRDPAIHRFVTDAYAADALTSYESSALHPQMSAVLREMQSWDPKQLAWFLGEEPQMYLARTLCGPGSRTGPLDRMSAIVQTDEALAGAYRVVADTIAADQFYTQRKLAHYVDVLGPDFESAVRGLNGTQHWLDAGAGEGRAILDYLGEAGAARVTAVAAEQSYRHVFDEIGRLYPDRFAFVRAMVPSPEVAALPAVDLITDVYGPLTYTHSLGGVLTAYAEIVRPGGDVFTLLEIDTQVVDASGSAVALETFFAEWIAASPAFDLVSARSYTYDNGQLQGVRVHLRRTGAGARVAPTSLVDLIPARPPQRTVQLTPHSPGAEAGAPARP